MVASNQLRLLDYREATQFLIEEVQIGTKQYQPLQAAPILILWLGADHLLTRPINSAW